MDLITLLCIIAILAIVGAAIWWARRENAKLDAEVLVAPIEPDQTPQRGGGGPKPQLPK